MIRRMLTQLIGCPRMRPSRVLDVILAATVSLPLPIAVLWAGDPIYVGLWYYFIVPAIALGLAATFQTKPLFLLGSSLGITATLLAYMSVNWSAARPEGLLVLGHLFSLPGAAIGIALAASLANRSQRTVTVLLLGFFGLLSGFLINQFVVCNTLMWCGPLSMHTR
ncbi:hypothetical protein [Stutzerimonas nitrititolerans]|uniref:hypothetical protein n=1 Tax=Stutzerimonas nitrititolerans TaxID=2482751 RepID=UPI000ECBE006|nr:hypothetical protein [Stutzerimonas nitrititolerans]HAQ27767.1 hypothetical protein [Pseudomonas sp.]